LNDQKKKIERAEGRTKLEEKKNQASTALIKKDREAHAKDMKNDESKLLDLKRSNAEDAKLLNTKTQLTKCKLNLTAIIKDDINRESYPARY